MSRAGSPPSRLRWLMVGILCLTLLSGCVEVGRLARLAPKVLSPGTEPHVDVSAPPEQQSPPPEVPTAEANQGFRWEALGRDLQGRQSYRVTIEAGGSPALVALSKLTPLFNVDGKDAPTYVAEAYFRANPGRTPASIQPGDQFVLTLPRDTFIARHVEERQEHLGQPVRVREYVSEQGDRLLYYLTDPFPLQFELRPADRPHIGQLHLHPDLAFLMGAGRLDPVRLARIVYRLEDPDIFQVQAMRKLAGELKPGEVKVLEIDRNQRHLDPVREAFASAASVEQVQEPDRAHLSRALPPGDGSSPYLAVEDALGSRTDLNQLEPGRVFRIEYQRDGTVRVSYLTGPDDALGRRDPYELRENERWAALYQRLDPTADTPVKWGPGEPENLEPFPTARDPHQQRRGQEHAFDYLVPGRALVLTFRPVRDESDERAQAELRALLDEIRTRYGAELLQLITVDDPPDP